MTRPAFIAPLCAALISLPAAAVDGKTIFEANCVVCHQADGAGTPGVAPPLQGTLGKRMATPVGRRYAASVLLNGLAGRITSKGSTYNGVMPAWHQLSDAELAAVLNHVLTTFNAAELPESHVAYDAETFAGLRATKPTAKDLRAWRTASD